MKGERAMKHAQEAKHRPWVKNAAIIFLSVMLVLTFFSKTIMNFSLPEVTGQYISSGTISASVSGTGTLSANMAYDVQLDETRTIRTVEVAAGDTVTAGQVLFTLEDVKAVDLTEAEDALDDMEYEYELALIQVTGSGHAADSQNIQNLRQQLSDAIAKRTAAAADKSVYDAAKQAMEEAQQRVNTLQNSVADIQGAITLATAGDEQLQSLQRDLAQRQAEKTAADTDLTEADAALAAAQAKATSVTEAERALEAAALQLTYLQQDYETLSASGSAEPEALTEAKRAAEQQTLAVQNAQADLLAAQTAAGVVSAAQTARDEAAAAASLAAQAESDALKSVDDRTAELTGELSSQLTEAEVALASAQTRLTEAQANLANTDMTDYDAADASVKSIQQQLESAVASLSDQYTAESKTVQAAELDVQRKKEKVEKQQALIEEKRSAVPETDVETRYGGTVASVNVVPGDVVGPGTSLAAVYVEGKEYTLSFSVSEEQSQKVHVGDEARVTTFHYGDIRATLSAIRSDPAAPGKNKLLEFTVGGDVTNGQELSLSIDLGDRNYPMVVPKSAVRTDSGGDFILTASAKGSPLGSRYIANRIPVTILASDGYNAAIETADGYTYHYVITTTSAPLSDGDQIRLSQ